MSRVGRSVLIYSQEITDRKRIEANLVRRLELESILSSVSSRLINSDAPALDRCILDALGQIGRYNRADRVAIYLGAADSACIDCRYEWCAPGVAARQVSRQGLSTKRFTWWQERLRQQEVISLRSVDELPPDAVEEKAALEQQGICSLLSLPLGFDGEELGVLCFEAT